MGADTRLVGASVHFSFSLWGITGLGLVYVAPSLYLQKEVFFYVSKMFWGWCHADFILVLNCFAQRKSCTEPIGWKVWGVHVIKSPH